MSEPKITVDAASWNRVVRERDEAREKAERYRLDANALMLQRDEAREELRAMARKALEGWQ